MKVSEINVFELKKHMKIEDSYEDYILNQYLDMAKKYVYSFTGLTIEVADTKEELCFAVLALVSDFYENRNSTVNTNIKPNPIVESILAMHSINYL